MRNPVWYVEGFTSSGDLESDGMRSWPKAEMRNPSGMHSLSLFFSPSFSLCKNSCCYNSTVHIIPQSYIHPQGTQAVRQVPVFEVWRGGVALSKHWSMKTKWSKQQQNSLTCTTRYGKKSHVFLTDDIMSVFKRRAVLSFFTSLISRWEVLCLFGERLEESWYLLLMWHRAHRALYKECGPLQHAASVDAKSSPQCFSGLIDCSMLMFQFYVQLHMLKELELNNKETITKHYLIYFQRSCR